jgi:hypothetical protein
MEASKKHLEIIQGDCQLSKISNPISLDNLRSVFKEDIQEKGADNEK